MMVKLAKRFYDNFFVRFCTFCKNVLSPEKYSRVFGRVYNTTIIHRDMICGGLLYIFTIRLVNINNILIYRLKNSAFIQQLFHFYGLFYAGFFVFFSPRQLPLAIILHVYFLYYVRVTYYRLKAIELSTLLI